MRNSCVILSVLVLIIAAGVYSTEEVETNVKFSSEQSSSNVHYHCPAGFPCTITCKDKSCYQAYINASLSSSLTLMCQDQGSCQESTLICPLAGPCNILCTQNSSCYKTVILGSTLRPPVSSPFKLLCSAQGSCQESEVRCPRNGSCDVICSHINSCYKTYFVAGSSGIWSSFKLYCTAQGSCQEAPVQAFSPISHVEIHCNDYNSCYRSNWMLAGARLMDLDCLGGGSCQNVDLSCPNGGVCSVNCGTQYGACYEANFDASNSLGFFITCAGQNGCQDSKFLCPMKGTCDINCSADYSCYEINVKSSFLCLDCNGTQACQSSTIDASAHSEVECIGENACYDVNWNIPPYNHHHYRCMGSGLAKQQLIGEFQGSIKSTNKVSEVSVMMVVHEQSQKFVSWAKEVLKKL